MISAPASNLIIQCFQQAYEVLSILKIYHPFINGPNGEYVKQMLMDYPDVRINIPPLSVMKDEISVAGEKNGVLAVVEKIKEISKVLVCHYMYTLLD